MPSDKTCKHSIPGYNVGGQRLKAVATCQLILCHGLLTDDEDGGNKNHMLENGYVKSIQKDI